MTAGGIILDDAVPAREGCVEDPARSRAAWLAPPRAGRAGVGGSVYPWKR